MKTTFLCPLTTLLLLVAQQGLAANPNTPDEQQPALTLQQLGLAGYASHKSECLASAVSSRGLHFVCVNVPIGCLTIDTRHCLIDVWDMKTRERVRSWKHPGIVLRLAVSPDGKRLLTAATGTTSPVQLWNLETGELLHSVASPLRDTKVPKHIAEVKSVFARHRDNWHFSIDSDYIPKVGFGATAVTFAADGRHFAVGGEDGTILLCDGDTGQTIQRLRGEPQRVWSLAFSPDGTRLLAGGRGNVQLWNMATGKLVCNWVSERLKAAGGARPDYRVPIDFAPDGTSFAFRAPWKGEFVIGDSRTGKELRRFTDSPPVKNISPIGVEPCIALLADNVLLDATRHQFELRDFRGRVTAKYFCGSSVSTWRSHVSQAHFMPEIAAIATVELVNDEMTLHDTWTYVRYIPVTEIMGFPQ